MGKVIVNDGGQHSYVNTTGVYQRLSALETEMLDVSPISIKETDQFTITVEHVYDSTTPVEYWVTTITPNDSNTLKTLLKKDFAYTDSGQFDSTAKESPYDHADRAKAVFAINASGWDSGATNKIDGVQIKDGVLVQNTPSYNTTWYTLGVDNNGLLNVYPNTTDGNTLLTQGIVNTWSFSIPIIQNGVEVSSSIYSLYSSYNSLYARQVIGQVTGTNEIVILTVDNKTSRSIGMTLPQCTQILLSKNCRIAYNLDGGGSAQTIYQGSKLNNPSDGTVRATPDLLYVSEYSRYDEYVDIQKKVIDAIGGFPDLREKLNGNQRFKLSNDDGTVDYTNNTNIDYNDIKGTKFFRHYADDVTAPNDVNAPFVGSVDVFGVNIQSSYTSTMQMVWDRKSNQIAYRFNNIGTWYPWNFINNIITFTNATLLNSWVNLGGNDPVLQYGVKNGVVYIKGVVKGGAASTVICTLPVGMRPKIRYPKGVVLNNGSVISGRIFIEPNGNLTSLDAASGWMYIDASYPAEQ